MVVSSRRKGVPPVYIDMASATPLERVEMIRRGLSPALVMDLAYDLRLSEDNLMLYLGLHRVRVRQKVVDEDRLSPRESEGVMALAVFLGDTLLGLGAAVEGGPDIQLDAAAWLGRWLRTPQPDLEHRAPLQFMDLGHGRALIATLLDQVRARRSG